MILFSSFLPSWNLLLEYYSSPCWNLFLEYYSNPSWNLFLEYYSNPSWNLYLEYEDDPFWNFFLEYKGVPFLEFLPGIWIRPLPGISSWNIMMFRTQVYKQTNNLSTYPFLFLELNSNLKQAERRDGSKVGMLLPSLLSAWIKSWPGGSQYKIS